MLNAERQRLNANTNTARPSHLAFSVQQQNKAIFTIDYFTSNEY